MKTYEITHLGDEGNRVLISARDEQEARRLAMIRRWGEVGDNIVPHAPAYKGRGLDVKEIKT